MRRQVKGPEIVRMKVGELVEDHELWPRRLTQIDDSNLASIRDAIRAGVKLPPPRCDRRTKTITDGFHRKAGWQGLLGADHEIDVEVTDYPDQTSMLLDAVRLNSRHGLQLDAKDKVDVILRLQERSVSIADICTAIGMTPGRYDRLMKRTARAPSGETVALPRGAQELAGTKLSKEQQAELPHIGGMMIGPHARMLCAQLRARAYDLTDGRQVGALRELKALLDEVLIGLANDLD